MHQCRNSGNMKFIPRFSELDQSPSTKGTFFLKGFGIYVKNNLLDPKHYKNMGEGLWLYLWLLDHMTSVNENGVGKVLKNKPITYEMVGDEIGMSRQVYIRWVDRLRSAGYIQTTRTPKGLCFTVNKAEKIFGNKGSIKDDTSPSKGSIKTNTSDVSKSKHPMYQNRASNNNNTNNNTDLHSTNVLDPTGLGPKPYYGKPEINHLFEYWSSEVGYDIESRVAANRRAASNLLKKHGKDKLEQLIRGVAMAQGDRYAPSISDFSQLQQKTTDLLVWGRRKHGESSVEHIS